MKVTIEVSDATLKRIYAIVRRIYCTLFVVLLIVKVVTPVVSLMTS